MNLKFILPMLVFYFLLSIPKAFKEAKVYPVKSSFYKEFLKQLYFKFIARSVIYILLLSIVLFFPLLLYNLLSEIVNIVSASYFSSLVLLIILYLFSDISQKDRSILVEKTKTYNNIVILPFSYAFIYFLQMPIKTYIYAFYLFITVLAQLNDLSIIQLIGTDWVNIVDANKLSIVLLVGIDRIKSTWQKEKIYKNI